jgi:hypothetical protein
MLEASASMARIPSDRPGKNLQAPFIVTNMFDKEFYTSPGMAPDRKAGSNFRRPCGRQPHSLAGPNLVTSA